MNDLSKRNTELTPDERKTIEELIKFGCSFSYVAKQLQRSKSTIANEISRGGGRQLYNAEVAQHEAIMRKQNKYLNRRKPIPCDCLKIINKGVLYDNTSENITKRLDALEAQIAILTEIIKEKNV